MRLQEINRSNSSMGTTIHSPSRGVGSGGAMSSLCLALYAIIFIEFAPILCLFFAYLFLVWSVTFSLSHH
jgi:hypothetical protein